MTRPRVVVLRGHSANPWELRPWELLADRFDVVVGVTGSNAYDLSAGNVQRLPVRALRDRLPAGRIGDLAVLALGDRYLGLEEALAGAAIVHSAELGVWFSGQPAALKRKLGYRLVLTVWETIPFLDTYRRSRGRRYKRLAVAEADLMLAATDRARRCLLLEGVPGERVVVSPPGIDAERFSSAAGAAGTGALVVSPGRLVWEKGHYDVVRALAALDADVRLLIVGAGPERERLLRYAAELGLAGRVEIRAVPYGEMPGVFASAACVVLASLPVPLWEEQFGMVLAEAMAAGAPIVASSSGAIPEVLAGSGAALFSPGDWPALAGLIGERLGGGRLSYPRAIVERYSARAAAERLAAAYERVLSDL
ncbi:Glycosyltransferase [Gaiella occulta]|uniref:Glycosyltransferase n=1 Tax=Gaiella occulta TaxID=1002870 RepID=A0A7M2YVZ1_9ACTN|nr:glycosyltransferase [Gaiella occulta]RDI74302.1 Glycosyltransferase [Gaiella occulta]